jgi:hypothetical protein
VLTPAEFFTLEAEMEGKGRSGGDLLEEFLQDMEAELRRQEDQYRDPAFLLSVLRDQVAAWNEEMEQEDRIEMPAEICQVLEVHLRENVRSSRLELKALVLNEKQERGEIWYIGMYHSGSLLEPPETDINIRWIPSQDGGEFCVPNTR